MVAVSSIAANALINEVKYKTMKATSLGIWYRQIPSGVVVNPLGEIIAPKFHNGSFYVVVNRKVKAVSKLPQLDYRAAMEFKSIFWC